MSRACGCASCLAPAVSSGVVAVGERRIVSVVPPRLSPSGVGRCSPVRGTSLPVAELLPLPRVGALRYGLGRVGGSGVVSNRAVIQALGWCCGDRLHITLIADSVVVHRSAGGVFAMPAKPYVVLPVSVRHRGGFGSGEQVLIAADP